MDIRKQINSAHSKPNTEKIVTYIGSNTEKFEELLDMFMHGEWRETQRAAWPLGDWGLKYPDLIQPYLEVLIDNLTRDSHVAVKRNTLRILQNHDIPEESMGKITDLCFEFLSNANEPVAIKVFAMSVLGNICKTYPELSGELKFLIEEQLPYSSAGFKSRSKKVLKLLSSLQH